MTEPLEGARLGKFLVDRGLITPEQLQDALADQRAFASRGLKLYLGQILMRRRWITSTQLVEALREARRAPVVCTRCGPQGIREFSDEMPECPSCGGPLRPASATEIASVTPVPIAAPGGGGALLFDRYAILGEIGAGGMARVFKAHDTKLDRVVALKLIRSSPGEGRAFRERFLREAKITARLTHPNIVRVHDYDADDDFLHFTMDLIEGCPLDQRLEAGDLDLRRRVGIVRDVARALHYAHEHGVVHRDVKPSNILIGADETPYLVDFGIAREQGLSQMTQAGQPIGTPYYMSPEHARGDLAEIDARSDVYSLGAVLYEALTGSPPFTGTSSQEIIEHVLHDDPEPPSTRNPEVPRELDNVTLKALAKPKDARYASAAGIARDLDAYLGGQPVSAKPTRRWPSPLHALRRHRTLLAVVAAVTLALAALGWWALRGSDPWIEVPGDPAWVVSPRPVSHRQYRRFLAEAAGGRRMFIPEAYLERGIPDDRAAIRGLSREQARMYCLWSGTSFLPEEVYEPVREQLALPYPPLALYVGDIGRGDRLAWDEGGQPVDPENDPKWILHSALVPARPVFDPSDPAAVRPFLTCDEGAVRGAALRLLLAEAGPGDGLSLIRPLLEGEDCWSGLYAAVELLVRHGLSPADEVKGKDWPVDRRVRLCFLGAWMGDAKSLDRLRYFVQTPGDSPEAREMRSVAAEHLLWLDEHATREVVAEAPATVRGMYERRFGRPR